MEKQITWVTPPGAMPITKATAQRIADLLEYHRHRLDGKHKLDDQATPADPAAFKRGIAYHKLGFRVVMGIKTLDQSVATHEAKLHGGVIVRVGAKQEKFQAAWLK